MKKLMEWLRHNQGFALALLLAIAISIWIYGCESRVASILAPNQKVNRVELNLEIEKEQKRLELELDNLIALGEARNQELDRQDEIKKKLAEFGMTAVESGGINPAGIATLLGSILGAGLLVDNRIKDKVIKNRPLNK
jgi:hypothetical protein